MVSNENIVIVGFVVLALAVAYVVRVALTDAVGEGTAIAIGAAVVLLVGLGGPRVYFRYASDSREE